MLSKEEQKNLSKALGELKRWAGLGDWDIALIFRPLEHKCGEARIQSEYKQATIVLNTDDTFNPLYRNDNYMITICHEFAHIWLWDLHNPETYDSNLSYNRLVEGCVEMVGRTLYKRVLKPLGY